MPFAMLMCGVALSCSKSKTSTDSGSPITDQLNIKYGSNVSWTGTLQDLHVDIYQPANATTKSKNPFVLMIHGGTFLTGTKENLAKMCRILADSGFVAASLEYRLGWNSGSGNCNGDTLSNKMAVYRSLQDANAAMRFIVANASNYGIDPNYLFVGGNSAGAVIADNLAYITEAQAPLFSPTVYNALGPLTSATNTLTNKFAIKGVASMWGALIDSNLIVPTNAVPMLFYHGSADQVIPVDVGTYGTCPNYPKLFGTLCMDRRLHKANVASVVNILIGGGHGPDEYTDAFLAPNIACFFHRIVRATPIVSQVFTGVVNSCR